MEVQLGIEGAQADRHRRRAQSPGGHVQGHVRPARLEGAQRQAQLADHLGVHVEGVSSVSPLRVRQSRPLPGSVAHPSMMMLTDQGAAGLVGLSPSAGEANVSAA